MNKFSINSTFTQKKYDIDIYIPDTDVPIEGYPIYYVLDGLSYFPFIRDIVRLQQINARKTGVIPAIVIGISHQIEEMREQRFRDFTAPTTNLVVPEHAKGKVPEVFGGAEHFLNFIKEELKPYVEKLYPVNQSKQAIIGHSLGGYFALWCLFTNQNTFNNYIVISPSVWWNDEELLKFGQHYVLNGTTNKTECVFLAVGEQEGFMVDHARKIGGLLKDYLTLEYYVAPEENHASVVPTVMSRAIRFCARS